jgi:hypothetical protein
MASWVLNCPQCNTEIIHSDIPEFESSIPDPFEPVAKPEFPKGGLISVCPNCKVTTVFQRHQLIYRSA